MATAGLMLFVRPAIRARVVPWLVSYAVGTLLGAALLGLVPEALESLAPTHALGTLLGGIMSFFILEKLVLWRHSHDDHECDVHKSTVTLVMVGDAVHTFVDGIVIAAATLVSLPLGATTALAVAAHEIPQEAGDFAILLAAGHSRRRAFLLNLTSAAGGLLGATAMLVFGSSVPGIVPYVLSFAAGSFLYIAMTDLIPTLHRGTLDRNAIRQLILIGLGVGTMILVQ
jgi:zinc and cadmium transporter